MQIIEKERGKKEEIDSIASVKKPTLLLLWLLLLLLMLRLMIVNKFSFSSFTARHRTYLGLRLLAYK